uniref:Response regulator n=1 Tax=Phenylobacterium glaciei TaxID=2803784 RepID=A0A974P1S5_9CAUL|nr:response regulator [Phenylobacterium glaciei]
MFAKVWGFSGPMSSQRLLPSSNLTPDDLSGLKILVVDDHSNTLRLITDVLRAGGVGRSIRRSTARGRASCCAIAARTSFSPTAPCR